MRRIYIEKRPGSSLIDHIPMYERFSLVDEAESFTGLSSEGLIASKLVNFVIPFYSDYVSGGFAERWKDVSPEILWNPLFWLGEDIAGRYSIVDGSELDDSGEPIESVESDDLWALRVSIEMTARGLYDQESGMWEDVLYPLGIDVETEDGLNRLRSWLNGQEDFELDNLKLPGYDLSVHGVADSVQAGDDWALHQAFVVHELSSLQQILYDSEDFLDAITEQQNLVTSPNPDVDTIRESAVIIPNVLFCASISFDYDEAENSWWKRVSVWSSQKFSQFNSVTPEDAKFQDLVMLVVGPEMESVKERLLKIQSDVRGILDERREEILSQS